MMSRTFQRQALAQAGVQVGEGLVQQQQLGARRERARERDALLLAAGEFMRVFFEQVRDAGQRGEFAHALRGIFPACNPEYDIARGAQVREQRVFLEHHADAALLRRQAALRGGHRFAIEQDAARARRLEAGDTAQHRGLCRSRWVRAGSRSRRALVRTTVRARPRGPRRRARELRPEVAGSISRILTRIFLLESGMLYFQRVGILGGISLGAAALILLPILAVVASVSVRRARPGRTWRARHWATTWSIPACWSPAWPPACCHRRALGMAGHGLPLSRPTPARMGAGCCRWRCRPT